MKRGLVLRSLAVGLGAAACTLSASATDLTLTADAHVNAARATTNYGSIANLYVGNGNTALLDFDLSSLPAGVTAGQISHASLTLFINRVNAAGAVSVAPVTSAWTESGVTYSSMPSLGSATNSFTASLAGQYVTLDVTALVQGWVSNPASNDGVALNSSTANILLDSKENDQTAHPAKLDVTITSMGATGATGAAGTAGAQGAQGMQGIQGAQGLPGAQGPTGTQGLQGVQGATGATGATGSAGPTGATGVAGATGANGATGVAGATGATGAQGATGSTVGGAYSATITYFPGSVVVYGGQNYLGLNNNTGVTPGSDPTTWSLISGAGATGATGAQGPMGVQGAPGATGAQGNQGATGATGVQGAQGAGGVTGATGAQGATGATGAAGNQGVTGATGPQGVQGTTGATGPTGMQGVAGTTGATGAQGSAGAAGTIAYQGVYSASTIYAQNAVVSDSNYYNSYVSLVANNTGNALPTSGSNGYWAVLSSMGAQGLQGAQGQQGATGPTGPQGATGSSGSGSAYGTGSSPIGIPLSIQTHIVTTSGPVYASNNYFATSASLSYAYSEVAPATCTPSASIMNYTNTDLTIQLTAVTVGVNSTTESDSGPLPGTTPCTAPATSTTSPNSCGFTSSQTVSAGNIFTMKISGQGSSSTGLFTIAISCQ